MPDAFYQLQYHGAEVDEQLVYVEQVAKPAIEEHQLRISALETDKAAQKYVDDQLDTKADKTEVEKKASRTDLAQKADTEMVNAVNDLLGVTILQLQIPGTVPGVVGTWITVNDIFGDPMYKIPREYTLLTEVDYTKVTARGWIHRANGAGSWCEIRENEFRVDPAFVPSTNTTEIISAVIPTEDSGSQYQQYTLEGVLTKTNTSSYTPTGDFHPATKKYVDDAVSSSKPQYINIAGTIPKYGDLLTLSFFDGYTGTAHEHQIYLVRFSGAGQEFALSRLAVVRYSAGGGVADVAVQTLSPVTHSDQPVYTREGSCENMNGASWNWGSWTEASANVLTKTNTAAYSPSQDYHPATKKYADDIFAKVADGMALGGQAYVDTKTRTILFDTVNYIIEAETYVTFITTPAFSAQVNGKQIHIPSLSQTFDDSQLTWDNTPNLYLIYNAISDLFRIDFTVSRGGVGDVYLRSDDLSEGDQVLGGFGSLSLDADGHPCLRPWEELLLDGSLESFDIQSAKNFPIFELATTKYVDDALGDIGAILDSINGEVV